MHQNKMKLKMFENFLEEREEEILPQEEVEEFPVSVAMVLMSHLSDIGTGGVYGNLQKESLYIRTEFCKYLILKYEDTNTKIQPNKEWDEFSKDYKKRTNKDIPF